MAARKDKKVGMTVELSTEDYQKIRTYEFPDFTVSQINAIKKFLYDIDYIGAKNIRVLENDAKLDVDPAIEIIYQK